MKRFLAKRLYWLAGKLSKIKTTRQLYRVESFDPLKTVPSGTKKLPCRLSTEVLMWSTLLDWDHWDHWALNHSDCKIDPCPTCGGSRCCDEG